MLKPCKCDKPNNDGHLLHLMCDISNTDGALLHAKPDIANVLKGFQNFGFLILDFRIGNGTDRRALLRNGGVREMAKKGCSNRVSVTNPIGTGFFCI